MKALKIILAIVLIAALAGGGVFGYFWLKIDYEIQIAEAQAELAEYVGIYGVLGEIWVGYTVFGDPVDEESIKVIHTLAKGDVIESIEITGR